MISEIVTAEVTDISEKKVEISVPVELVIRHIRSVGGERGMLG